jgi:hypothetical protein
MIKPPAHSRGFLFRGAEMLLRDFYIARLSRAYWRVCPGVDPALALAAQAPPRRRRSAARVSRGSPRAVTDPPRPTSSGRSEASSWERQDKCPHRRVMLVLLNDRARTLQRNVEMGGCRLRDERIRRSAH